MKDGKIIYHGLATEIISPELIDDVFAIPVEILSHPFNKKPILYYK